MAIVVNAICPDGHSECLKAVEFNTFLVSASISFKFMIWSVAGQTVVDYVRSTSLFFKA